MTTLSMPPLSDLMTPAWACEAKALRAFLCGVSKAMCGAVIDEGALPRARAKGASSFGKDAIAVVPVRGILMRGRGVPWLSFIGISTTGYDDIRDAVAAAVADPAIKRIVLDIDSPGGDACGLVALHEALRAAASEKDVIAAISGMGTSAAYFIACGAGEIVAEADAIVGSIGVFAVVQDMSEAAWKLGIKVHVVRSGVHKGVGTPGALVTAEHLEQAQELIDDLAAGFVAAVAAGRHMTEGEASALATGATWTAQRAEGLGLIDRIGTLAEAAADSGTEDTMKRAATTAGPRAEKDEEEKESAAAADAEKAEGEDEGEDEDEDESAKSASASIGQLEALGADAAFIVRALKVSMTLADARVEWAEARARRAEERATAAESAAPKRSGVDPRRLGASAASDTAPDEDDFLALARARKAKHGGTLAEAMRAVSRSNPKAHDVFLGRSIKITTSNGIVRTEPGIPAEAIAARRR